MSLATHDIDALALALYNLSALRRDLQRFAGIEHAVGGLTVLGVVHRTGPARISDVAAQMQVNLSVASRQIQALEEAGHVDRLADPHDGRSSLIAITDSGRAKLDRAHERLVTTIATAVEDWNHDEVAGLADGLVRLRAALGTCDAPGDVARGAAPAPGTPTPTTASPADRASAPTTSPADRSATSTTSPADAPTSTATSPADAPAAAATVPADRSAADPTLTPADPAGAHHEEHLR